MHSHQVNQKNDEEQALLREDDGAPYNLEMVVLDLQEQVALMSEKINDCESRMSDKTENLEDQVALIARKMENSEEHVEELIAQLSENPKRTQQAGIDEDTFSIIMTSKVKSRGWFFGYGTLYFQMILILLILGGYFRLSEDSTPFDAPISVKPEVRTGQYFAVILSLLSQQDILSAIDALIAFRSLSPANKDSGFYRLLVDDNDADELEESKECETWFLRAILPNCLKLIQGLSVLFVSFIVIIKSVDLIALLRDFSALYFLSEIDNIVFRVASRGYFGEDLQTRTEKVKHVKYEEVNNTENVTVTPSCGVERFKTHLKMFVLSALAVAMYSYLIYVARGQTSGDFLRTKYPDCTARIVWRIGDGKCDNRDPYNTKACGYDGGDCLEFNNKYPGCKASNPSLIGNGRCENENVLSLIYNTEACGYDGGDCKPREISTLDPLVP